MEINPAIYLADVHILAAQVEDSSIEAEKGSSASSLQTNGIPECV